MGMRESFEGRFHPDATSEEIKSVAEELKERSFYAGALVDTFFGEVDPGSIVADTDTRWRSHTVGGRIIGVPQGVMRLTWSDLASVHALSLKISVAPERTREKERERILEDGNYRNRATIESNGKSPGMFATPNEDGTWTQEVIDGLTISFYPSRWPIAPTDPSRNFDYWLLTNFVPRFLNDTIAPLARIPRKEMTGEVIISDPEP